MKDLFHTQSMNNFDFRMLIVYFQLMQQKLHQFLKYFFQ